MSKKRGLGRGLDALLGGVENITRVTDEEQVESMRMIPIEQIKRGEFQPRKRFDPETMQELADSIASQGIIQPIVVRPIADGFELIVGERRWRAAQQAGLFEIPVIVRDLDNTATAAVALIENMQREDLNPLEEAGALLRLQTEFSMTHQQIAEAVGRSRAAVSNLLRLHDLHEDVKDLLTEGKVEMGHARALLSLSVDQQPLAALKVVSQSLSVRGTEALVKKMLSPEKSVDESVFELETNNPDIRYLEQQLSDKLGAKVVISHATSGRGRVEIGYNSVDELDGILGHIH
jgi:ParB family chromosome partitioning protein